MTVVHLELLGTTFAVSCATPDWARLIATLWEPFVVDGRADAVPFAIERDGEAWRTVCSWNPDLVQADPWFLCNEIRHLLVEEALARSDVVAVHAAALEIRHRAVVLVGESGAGKTTLTFELAGRGWRYLTDDLVVLDRSGDLVPFPKPLGIKEPERWREFSAHLDDLEWPGPPSDVFLVPPAALGWRDTSARLEVGGVAFLERGADGELITDGLTAGRAVAELKGYARPYDPDSLGLLAAMCTTARCVRVVSDDPGAAADFLEDLLP